MKSLLAVVVLIVITSIIQAVNSLTPELLSGPYLSGAVILLLIGAVIALFKAYKTLNTKVYEDLNKTNKEMIEAVNLLRESIEKLNNNKN